MMRFIQSGQLGTFEPGFRIHQQSAECIPSLFSRHHHVPSFQLRWLACGCIVVRIFDFKKMLSDLIGMGLEETVQDENVRFACAWVKVHGFFHTMFSIRFLQSGRKKEEVSHYDVSRKESNLYQLEKVQNRFLILKQEEINRLMIRVSSVRNLIRHALQDFRNGD